MKKKILIVSHAMYLGGVERSLVGLLEAFDYSKYEVDLFLLRHEGELLEYIPKEVNILPEVKQYTVLARPMIDILKEGHILLTLGRVVGKIKAKHYIRKYHQTESEVPIDYSHKFTYKLMPFINKDINYDLAISFLTPHYIVSHKVNAKKKIAWIHTDYDYIQTDIQSQLNMWKSYDYIASISKAVTDSFLKKFPQLSSKIIELPNVLPINLINIQAKAFDVNKEITKGKFVNLLSIGRFCYQKNFDNVPAICSEILKTGLDVKWYLIGFGIDEMKIRKKIKEFKVENNVIILGKKSNPYPYIKACDVYIQPSRYEGKSVCVIEAQALHKPVIITDYPTSKSQLENGVDGLIVPSSNEGCANGIIEALKKKEILNELIENTFTKDYSNRKMLHKLYNIF